MLKMKMKFCMDQLIGLMILVEKDRNSVQGADNEE